VRSKLWVTAPIAQWFSLLRLGLVSVERREKDLAFVIDALGVEDSFAGVAFERCGIDMKPGADFGRALPSGRTFMLGETWDLVGMADLHTAKPVKRCPVPVRNQRVFRVAAI
jgi:hypothetical protein